MTPRVVWGFLETAASRSPTNRLRSVDLPTFGFPMMETNPDRKEEATRLLQFVKDLVVKGVGKVGVGKELVALSRLHVNADGFLRHLKHINLYLGLPHLGFNPSVRLVFKLNEALLHQHLAARLPDLVHLFVEMSFDGVLGNGDAPADSRAHQKERAA